MGNLEVTLLPVLGGFLFLYYSHWTKYYVRRRSGYNLFFLSCGVGLLLLSTSYIVILLLQSFFPSATAWGESMLPERNGYAGTYLGSIIVGLAAIGITNAVSYIYQGYRSDDRSVEDIKAQKVAKEEGTDLEVFLDEALTRAKLVMVVLRDRHFYVGFVTSSLDPLGRSYIRVLKVASGFRDPINREINVTTNYNPVIDGIRQENNNDGIDNVKLDDLNIVFPVDRIDTISYFNTGIEDFFDDNVPSVERPDPSVMNVPRGAD